MRGSNFLLRHLGHVGIDKHLSRAGQVALTLLEATEAFDDARHLGMLAGQLAKALHVASDVRVGQRRVQLVEPHRETLELLAQ